MTTVAHGLVPPTHFQEAGPRTPDGGFCHETGSERICSILHSLRDNHAAMLRFEIMQFGICRKEDSVNIVV